MRLKYKFTATMLITHYLTYTTDHNNNNNNNNNNKCVFRWEVALILFFLWDPHKKYVLLAFVSVVYA